MREVHTLLDTKQWMEKAIPHPTNKNIHTQLGVHFEEFAEMMDTITPVDKFTAELMESIVLDIKHFSVYLKAHDNVIKILPQDRIEYLDSLCDQIVTAVGCAHNSGFNIVGAMNEVNRSNYSKFDDHGNPVFDENQKIIKGPNYSKAQLDLFA